MRFQVGKEYQNAAGGTILIISVDSPYVYQNTPCPIAGVIKVKGANVFNSYAPYDLNGKYCGLISPDYKAHHLISDEPSDEEISLIKEMANLCRGDFSGEEKEARMLKVIRALRKKD